MLMHDIPFLYLKEKICKEHQKKKKIKMLLYKFASVFLEDVGVI